MMLPNRANRRVLALIVAMVLLGFALPLAAQRQLLQLPDKFVTALAPRYRAPLS